MLYPGAPMIYYGDEAGMWGADDPDNRKPMVWPDLICAPEQALPNGGKRPEDLVYFDWDMFNFYQTLLALRRAQEALRRGDCRFEEAGGSEHVVGISRNHDGEGIPCLFNRVLTPQEVILPALFQCHQTLYGGRNLVPVGENRHMLAGKAVVVLVKAR